MKPITALIIMDGFGLTEPSPTNAVSTANTPVLDGLLGRWPNTRISASGLDVGLPAGQIGNSEVGHTNIGAGRVVYQDLTHISHEIETGDFFQNPVYCRAMDSARDGDKALHLLGLTSPGGVHSHTDHLLALLDMAKARGLEKVWVHCFMDGRDTPPASGIDSVRRVADKCRALGVGHIATVTGRFYAMDRDKRWERVERAYNALVCGEGIHCADPVAAVQASYDAGVTDEFIEPVICDPDGMIAPGDSVIFFNFRPDRAREITRALVDPAFDGFARKKGFFPLTYVCTTQYDETLPNVTVAYPPEALQNTFGQVLSDRGMTQLRIAETEKYAHVTFFFNGGVEQVYPGEDRILVNSPKQFPTYDLIPEMSAPELTDKAVAAIESGKYDVMILNFANCDMVGHTGVLAAAIRAVETVDTCVGRVVEAVLATGGVALVTADHGNAEVMVDTDGVTPHTAHTTNLVPLILCGAEASLRDGGRLCDLAPTMLHLLGIPQPPEMTGTNLIEK